jgi:hypothetical protein
VVDEIWRHNPEAEGTKIKSHTRADGWKALVQRVRTMPAQKPGKTSVR